MEQERLKKIKQDNLRKANQESHVLTVDSIQDAMIVLVNAKSFESISISDICQKAGVSRTAFYRNYDTKEDVLRSIAQAMAIRVFQKTAASTRKEDARSFWKGKTKSL